MSINYELAKELLEAGYPRENILESIDGQYQFPTLSELIEACGQHFTCLKTHLRKSGVWVAGDMVWDCEWSGEVGEGETPEEAVANLWLVLNKK